MQQALVTLLNSVYSDIHAMEDSMDIRVDQADYRPRIEYFHDAVRALTAGVTTSERLRVEFLAYDIAMLRHITSNPLARKKGTEKPLSPVTALKTITTTELYSNASITGMKSALAGLYKKYAVIFSALFARKAEDDYQERSNECNETVENAALLQNILKKAAKKPQENVNMEALIDHYCDDPEIAAKILAAFGLQKHKTTPNAASETLAAMMKESDRKLKIIEKAHFTYVTSQLAIYESSRDIVKKMAVGGMNIVGNFVEDALRTSTQTDRGR